MIEMLSNRGVNMLVAEDTYAKISFISALINSMKGSKIIYLDLDTVFTAYIRSNIIELGNGNKVEVFLACKEGLEDMLVDVSLLAGKADLIVLDSLHGFYHAYKDKLISTRLNQLLTFHISFLLNIKEDCSLLVTNVRRRIEPKTNAGRYIWGKSSAIFYARLTADTLIINIIKHDINSFNGKEMIISMQK